MIIRIINGPFSNAFAIITSGNCDTIFLNIKQNQLKTTKQIYWISEILLHYLAEAKNPVFVCMFIFLFVVAAIVTSPSMTVLGW